VNYFGRIRWENEECETDTAACNEQQKEKEKRVGWWRWLVELNEEKKLYTRNLKSLKEGFKVKQGKMIN
jgi:hypothetical protein